MTGTGYVNNPRGEGNADWVTGAGSGDDSVHPSALGQAYLATRVVAGIADRLASIHV